MKLRHLAAMAAACTLLAGGGVAQDKFPNKPIRLVVPLAVGSPTDIVACVMAAKMVDPC
jgi:tripartite-type tricarboxylate transporter receptor subunit TctC